MILRVEVEQEEDGRWIAEIPELSGALSYGQTEGEARSRVQALALGILAGRLEHGEQTPELGTISFAAA
jgi:predicted RNase H-like HicB family nuclease